MYFFINIRLLQTTSVVPTQPSHRNEHKRHRSKYLEKELLGKRVTLVVS